MCELLLKESCRRLIKSQFSRKALLFVMIVGLSGCRSQSIPSNQEYRDPSPKKPGVFRIAFGSCAKQNKPQDIWKAIVATKPDLWIWLGDAIYAKWEDIGDMREHYRQQKDNPNYQLLLKNVPVIGVWDDHDFGSNKSGNEFRYKEESRQLYLDFLGEPKESPRRKQQGIYASFLCGEPGKQIKIILMDVHWSCDDPGPNGDLLGAAQWKWLEKELQTSQAQVNIIGSGIQILASEQPYDKWANYGKSRDRLLKLIRESKDPNVILISGDRHLAEISKLEGPEVNYPIYDITSSGLTHTVDFFWHVRNLFQGEPNRYRVGNQLLEFNFGEIDIEWGKRVEGQIRDSQGRVRIKKQVIDFHL